MSALQDILNTYRQLSQSEREKGTYFEELIRAYLTHEPTYADLYSDVWMYSDWAKANGKDGKDVGIDLVAKTRATDEYHAIQCKCYDETYRLQKSDIDSFFTASGQAPFCHRIIVTTTNHWSSNAEAALIDQTPPVTKIDLQALEDSVIDWSKYQPDTVIQTKQKNQPRPHQQNAIKAAKAGLADASRGTLLMACGTGKTFTSLKIAEELAGANKRVLFLVPSLSLLSQTLTEWTHHSQVPLHSFAVCSDSDVGKKRKADDDKVQTFTHELRYPATTDAKRLAEEVAKRHDAEHMSVVFSTYHSIEVIGAAQNEHGLADFDLIICDEAHRTTGATFADEDESAFVRVHDETFIHGHKRLYMTATPRIYGEGAKASADRGEVALASMDDESLFGKNLHTLTFSEAVSRGLLCDYKVIVLSMDEHHINRRLQNLLKDENNTLKVDDAAKIIGCWKALSKHQMKEGLDIDPNPMQRAVAFCQVIEPSTGKKHKVSSKQIAEMFQAVVEAYQEHEDDADDLVCEVQHVDGSMNATEKETKINWLKAQPEDNSCKILSNVRCLSEGVDVPALDAVLFLTPRNSQVDVVQSVGRVMRNAPGKVRGYVILPVVIPAGTSPSEALNDNQTYRVVWEVLQALRSHDDRFDAMINKLDLIGQDQKKMEIVAINDKTVAAYKGQKTKQRKKDELVGKAKNGSSIGTNTGPAPHQTEIAFDFEVGEIERALVAKVVEKCGNRHHWEEWAKDIAKIAQTHISRIRTIVTAPENKVEKAAFKAFVTELRDDLNHAISEDEVIEMLAQHLITEPVFDALFEGYNFGQNNPVSQAMERVITLLHEHNLDTEADTLGSFYASVKMRAEGIDNAAGKQKIIVELYDKFFRNAFPRLTERLGIVYTPVEVVDFIIHSINHLLQTEFNQELGSEGVHILDPFTGTGTFITRLLQSGLIPADKLPHKYANEIHANELVLLAYYIAAINIEAVYHGQVGGEYQPFSGICLTDTFQMYEQEDRIQDQLKENSRRRTHQRSLTDIRVIMGNPPYSIGQSSANDNNQNIGYPLLDARLENTYVKASKASLSKGLYDSYIRAFRWASDRVGDRGIIGFVTNGGYLDANTADGMRKCLAEEFSSLYVFHLRGNARTSGEQRRKEKDNVFGLGSRTPIAITLLIKNPEAKQHGQIYFHDIGDYLTREDKLEKISQFVSVAGIDAANGWTQLVPDQHGDWLNQRDDSFADFIVMGDKRGEGGKVIFENYSQGVVTARDYWCYNPSKQELSSNMDAMISLYNHEVDRFHKALGGKALKELEPLVDGFINLDPTQISWSVNLKKDLARGTKYLFQPGCLTQGHYRPFTKQWLYFNRSFNERVLQMPKIFPNQQVKNLVICITGLGENKGFSALMSDVVPNFHFIAGSQCFPLYLYDEDGSNQRDAITDVGLAHFQNYYPELTLTKETLFYYIYGLLHSEEYRARYGDNLSKALPRIPRVRKAADFTAFEQAGRKLAQLHLNYETVDCYQATIDSNAIEDSHYRVVKMKHPKVKRNGKNENDLSTIVFNNRITIENIPTEAYRYVINGKSAIAWVMERQCDKEDKDSGIRSDANLWATETMDNSKYPLELLLRVITVSLETIKIVDALPALDLE
ncbi:DNA damage-inducible protein [Aeromonas caviae]|nr:MULTISPECIES: type ISP restriction/modification enzyme [Aeromonas]GKR03041.1 DNA damage-inducible protein [Aeromonas caviae]GKR11828.1 DNA damage-inducible protein [Aeromonas caviae]GKR16075.1 DNA damage-inducible protein [Aeromonas caviae]GKR20137.1 DNA damage-inducible protein [Aeromonas caviae]GKR41220.1 DNA damage-inducible protein [Aeromonas caviae]